MKQRKRPAPPQNRPSRNHSPNAAESTVNRAEDGYLPDAEARAVKRAVEVLQEHGYGIAMRCLDCQHPITSAASLARMRGPKCAAKAVAK